MSRILPGLLLIPIIICCLFGSCSRKSPSVAPHLLLAESIMETSPDSALKLLLQADTSQLATPADRALNILLVTQARYKTDLGNKSTQPIQAAAEYFYSVSDRHHLMLSLYYLGEILRQQSEYDNAIINLLEAERYAKRLENWFYLGLISRSISSIYEEIYLYDMSVSYSRQAVDAFKMAGNTEYWNYERTNLAKEYMMAGELDKAFILLDSVLNIAETTGDSTTIVEAIATRGYVHMHNQDWKRGITDLEFVEKYRPQHETARDKQAMVYAYTRLGQFNKADSIYDLLPKGQSDIFITLHSYHASKKDYESAYKALSNQYSKQDSLVRIMTRQKVTAASNKFNKLQFDKEILVAKNQRLLLSLILMGALFVACLIVGYLIFKKRVSDKKITSLLKDYDLLATEFDKLASKHNKLSNPTLSQKWKTLFTKQFSMLDQLCAEVYTTPTSKTTNKLAKNIQEIILGLKNNTDFINGIFSDIDFYNNNLIYDLQNSTANLSQTEYTLLALWCSGLSNQAISILLSIDIERLYVRKSRLKTKISKLDFQRKTELLELISHNKS